MSLFDEMSGSPSSPPGASYAGATPLFREMDQLVGNPEHLDARVPVETRVQGLLQQHVHRRSGWEDVQPEVQRYFPNVDSTQIHQAYDRMQREHRQREIIDHTRQDMENNPMRSNGFIPEHTNLAVRRFIAGVPGVGSVLPIMEDFHRAGIRRRMEAGTETQADLVNQARYERREGDAAQRGGTLGGKVEDAALAATRIIGEIVLGAGLLKAAGVTSAIGGLGTSAAGDVAAQVGARGAIGAAAPALGRYALQQGAMTLTIPSTWAAVTHRNIENGREAYDFRGLAALPKEYAQMLIMGSMGKPIGAIGGATLGGFLGRSALRAAAFPAEQQAADLVNYGLGLQKQYGLAEKFRTQGKNSRDAWEDFFIQAATGVLFGGWHEATEGHIPDKATPEQKDALKAVVVAAADSVAEGAKPEQIGQAVHDKLATAMKEVDPAPQRNIAPSEPQVEATKPSGTPAEGVPIMITQQMRADLKNRGFADAEINKMKPAEAWNLLQTPSQANTPSAAPAEAAPAVKPPEPVIETVARPATAPEPTEATPQQMPSEMTPPRPDRSGRESVREAMPLAPNPLTEPAPAPEAAPKESANLRPPVEALKDLWRRNLAGERITKESLDPVLEQAGISARDRDVVSDFLRGKTMEEIAADEKYSFSTRARAGQIIKDASESLGLDKSIYQLMHKDAKKEMSLVLAERGDVEAAAERLSPDEQRDAIAAAKKKEAKLDPVERSTRELEKELQKIASRYTNDAVKGRLTPEKKAAYEEQARVLERKLASLHRDGASEGESSGEGNPPSQTQPAEVREPHREVAEPQGQAAPPAGPVAADQGQNRGASAAGADRTAPTAEPLGVNKAEVMPPVEYHAKGGTFGDGPLIATGSNKVAAAKNEQVNKNRVAEGLDEVNRIGGHAFKEDWESARIAVGKDTLAPSKLAEEVVKTNGSRTLNRIEMATLLHGHVSIRNELAQIADAWKKGGMEMSDRTIRANNNRKADLLIQRDLIDRALNLSGSETAGTLAIRRAFVKFDYSYEGMLDQVRAANPKKPLTPAEEAKIKELTDANEKLQAELDAANKALDAGGKGFDDPAYPAAREAKIKVKVVQQNLDKIVGGRVWEAMSTGEKSVDLFKRLHVAELISSPITAGKVGMSSVQQILKGPVAEGAASLWKLIPGVRIFAEKAPIEGRGFNWDTEVKSIKSAATEGMASAWQTLMTGESKLDNEYGSRFDAGRPYTWIELFGNFHAAEKAPAVEAEFVRAKDALIDAGKKAGADVTSEAAREKIGQQAYDRAIQEKYQEDNIAVKAWSHAIRMMKTSESSGANALGHTLEAMMPIVRTPTNIIISAIEHAIGVPLGLGRIATQHIGGIEGLTQPQAEGIMRQLKRGTIGIPMFMLGFYLSKNVGGFYSGNRPEDDVKAGDIKTPLGTIPGWAASHHPALMAMQLGASIRRASEDIKRGETQGMALGAVKGFGALLEEVPFVRAQTEFAHLDQGVGPLARSFAIPQFFQWLAKVTDMKPGKPDPHGLWQQLEVGIPGARQLVGRK